MNDLATTLTPKEKLAQSRAALLAVMGYRLIEDANGAPVVQAIPKPPSGLLASRLGSSVLGRWWRGHPIHTALELADPGLQAYAKRNPLRLVAYAAGVGCALVLLKPWKLVSVGAVIALLFRSSDIERMLGRTLISQASTRQCEPGNGLAAAGTWGTAVAASSY